MSLPFARLQQAQCVSEIIELRRAAMLFADDMVDLAAGVGVVLVNQTVFTQALSPQRNETAQIVR